MRLAAPAEKPNSTAEEDVLRESAAAAAATLLETGHCPSFRSHTVALSALRTPAPEKTSLSDVFCMGTQDSSQNGLGV